MHLLVAGQRVEFLDAGLDVVAGDFLPIGDRFQIHLVDYVFVCGDGFGGHVNAQIALCLEHGDP